MNFNRYIFDCYLATDSAQATLAFFNQFTSLIQQRDAVAIHQFVQNHLVDSELSEWQEYVNAACDMVSWDLLDKSEGSMSLDEAILDYEFFIDDLLIEAGSAKQLLIWQPAISFVLSIVNPDYFIPYFFRNQFFQLESIFRAFQIPLPPVPSKQQHQEKLTYYGDLCRALYDFRCIHNLSAVELWAFLYDFALKTISDFISVANVPEALNVFITGGNKADIERFYAANDTFQSFWAGHHETQPGDIVLLYGLAPYSGIVGIFRVFSKSYYDPFSYYPQRIWVGAPIKIPSIGLYELKENKVWRKKGLVKANMQGVNGRACSAQEYEALLQMLAKKGFDVSVLPERSCFQSANKMLLNEQNVEEKLLEPLLLRLGFLEKDWLRQMSLRMGRGDRVYPDYALLPVTKPGEETALFIWEAKHRIVNTAQLKEAFFQAKSYALRLNCVGFGLVSVEGVWISLAITHFAFDKLVHYSWTQLANADEFTEFAMMSGKAQLQR